MAAIVHIGAFKRAPFLDDIVFIGYNWTGAALAMQIRHANGDTGAPVIDLVTQPAGTQGLSVVYDPAYNWTDENGAAHVDPASIITINISEATLEAIPFANPYYGELRMEQDIHVTPVGDVKRIVSYGEFIIYPGATI